MPFNLLSAIHRYYWTDTPAKYRLVGFSGIIRFIHMQIIRFVFIVILFVLFALTMFIDLRDFVFLLGDWNITLSFLAFIMIFAASGRHRVEMKLTKRGTPPEVPSQYWVVSVLVFEIAIALAFAQSLYFWIRYR